MGLEFSMLYIYILLCGNLGSSLDLGLSHVSDFIFPRVVVPCKVPLGLAL